MTAELVVDKLPLLMAALIVLVLAYTVLRALGEAMP